MTSNVSATEFPEVQRELSDAELEAVSAGKGGPGVVGGGNSAGPRWSWGYRPSSGGWSWGFS